MNYFQGKYRVPSARLEDWDYASPGYYFVTICTKDHKSFFGEVSDGKMCLSKIGGIARKFWLDIPNHFPFVDLDEFIIMPNHVHGIVIINDTGETMQKAVGATHNAPVETQHCTLDAAQHSPPVETQHVLLVVETYPDLVIHNIPLPFQQTKATVEAIVVGQDLLKDHATQSILQG